MRISQVVSSTLWVSGGADSMEDLLRQSDVVSIHAPLNKRTNRMFNTQLFDQMKRGSVLINTARGPIVDLDALYEAMKKDIVLAAGLGRLTRRSR